MELVINTRGSKISKSNECFLICVNDVREEISSKKVERILITTSANITTDALKLAVENNIDVIFLEYSGKPFARVWHSKLGSITTIRRNQLKLRELELGTELVKELIIQKLENQNKHLKKLKLNRSDKKIEIINKAIEIIDSHKNNISILKGDSIMMIREIIEGYEGHSARVYFETLSNLLAEKYSFDGRSKNPAKDEFNCMLNYAYGILYSRVETACIIAGLDPYIGIMHVDNYNRTSLVFDLIEIYIVYMDEIVFGLFSKRKVKNNMFDNVEDGVFGLIKMEDIYL